MQPKLHKSRYNSLGRQLRRIRRRKHWRRYGWLYLLFVALVGYNGYRICEQGPDHWAKEQGRLLQAGWERVEATFTPDYSTAGYGGYRVTRVVDGDTIHVSGGGGTTKIRLHGIDSPERGQPYGRAAGRALADLLAGGQIRLERVDIDRYGRVVAKVYVGETYVNKAMVEQGYAWWYRRYAQGDLGLWLAQWRARRAGKGIWAEPDPIPPWEWRRQRR